MTPEAARDRLAPFGEGRLPVLDFGGELLADSHAHLDMLEDPAGALARAALAGVGFIATVASVVEEPERTFGGLDGWLTEARAVLDAAGHAGIELPDVRIIVGIHPHDARLATAHVDARIAELAADPRVCALGELGLDYYYDHSPRERQREVFERHLALAHELDLPICIHLRDAHADGLEILSRIGLPARGAVLHCITVDQETIAPFVALGCTPSFAGPITFKSADAIRGGAASVDPGNVMVETDCPFMAPEPWRGKKNEPALVGYAALKMAELHQVAPATCARSTAATARRIYGRRR